MTIRYGQTEAKFELNWDGVWIGRRPNTLERIYAWITVDGDWVAYRKLVINPMWENSRSYKSQAKRFDHFIDVLARWPSLPAIDIPLCEAIMV